MTTDATGTKAMVAGTGVDCTVSRTRGVGRGTLGMGPGSTAKDQVDICLWDKKTRKYTGSEGKNGFIKNSMIGGVDTIGSKVKTLVSTLRS